MLDNSGRLLGLVLFFGSGAATAQPVVNSSQPAAALASAPSEGGPGAAASPAVGALAPTGTATASTANEERLRRQLQLNEETLARHEREIRELRATLAATQSVASATPAPATEAWYERLRIRGYLQIRYNQIPSADNNPNLINEQGDKSVGGTGGFAIRRGRVILFGDLHPRVSIYIQPDFASSIGEQLNVGIMRDYYADIFLDRKREFRLRIGQSKIPFGFENMQSSQNRIALDRGDSLNSAVLNERDLGVFFYWAPDHIRRRFRHFVEGGLKGSGDFGVIALGVYNGQSLNRFELNKFPHTVFRLTWPFAIGSQFLELSTGGYYGQFTVKLEDGKDGTKFTSTAPDHSLHDARGHVSAILYPQPLGFVFEYNAGIGPSLGREEPTVVDSRFLHGGYLQVMSKFDRVLKTVALIPYIRAGLYEGGKKFFLNAPRYDVREVELGLEWQIVPAFELTVAYLLADRTSDKFPYKQEAGQVTRLHAQLNY